jgi:hypothetical protein
MDVIWFLLLNYIMDLMMSILIGGFVDWIVRWLRGYCFWVRIVEKSYTLKCYFEDFWVGYQYLKF